MTSSMHVYGGFATPADVSGRVAPVHPTTRPASAVATPRWAPPMALARVGTPTPIAWPAPIVWPAPDPAVLHALSVAPRRIAAAGWAPPTLIRSSWPAPTAVAPARSVDGTATRRHDLRRVRRGRTVIYAAVGVAAAVVSFAAIAIR